MILKWNSEEPFTGGWPIQTYHKGDTIKPDIFPYAIFEMMLNEGKLIYADPPKIPKIKLSISVMAHPSRSHFFPRLREKLGEIPFSIDQKNNLIENCKAAWKLYNPESDFHVVIQDDAIICNHFRERAEQFITDMENERIKNDKAPYIYNFFVIRNCSESQMQSFEKQGYMIEESNRGGVAICLPTNQIESMLKVYDTLRESHDDERINLWERTNNFATCFPIPSLIDHNDHKPSLAGHVGLNRQAWKFIDNVKHVIPKQIHQLWCGPKPAPWKWMKTWREKNPGWLHRLWTEKELFAEKWINQYLINYYYERGIWHGVADVARYEILYNYGGCFFDADAECLLSIDDLFNENMEGYSCYENEKCRPGLISPLMAAPKDSKFALELIRGLSEIKEPGDPWLTTGNKYMGEMVKKTACNVKIYPSYYFLPEHFDPAAEKYTGTDKIYSRHQWGTTLDKYNEGV